MTAHGPGTRVSSCSQPSATEPRVGHQPRSHGVDISHGATATGHALCPLQASASFWGVSSFQACSSFFFFLNGLLSNAEKFLPPPPGGLDSGFCGFYCLCQTCQPDVVPQHLPAPPVRVARPVPPPRWPSRSRQREPPACRSPSVSRGNQQVIFSVLNKLLYFDTRGRDGCAFLVPLGPETEVRSQAGPAGGKGPRVSPGPRDRSAGDIKGGGQRGVFCRLFLFMLVFPAGCLKKSKRVSSPVPAGGLLGAWAPGGTGVCRAQARGARDADF